MNSHQTLRLSQMIQTVRTKACWSFVQNSKACARIIINLCRVWLTLELLLDQNSLVCPSTHVLLNGVLGEEPYKKNYAWILLERLELPLGHEMWRFIYRLPTDVVRIAVLWHTVVSPKLQFYMAHSRPIQA